MGAREEKAEGPCLCLDVRTDAAERGRQYGSVLGCMRCKRASVGECWDTNRASSWCPHDNALVQVTEAAR
jgi:hypothetical protein